MTSVAHVAAGRSSPALRYRNVAAAVDWLCQAFGFEVRGVETDENGVVIYAELSFGNTIIMLGAVSGFDIDGFMTQPDAVGGAETQCCYYVVDDLDAHYARARGAGCKIVIDMQTRPNGARAFTCRDPEGHLWCFGTYDPWHSDPVAAGQADEPAPVMDMAVLAAAAAAMPAHARASAGRLSFPARLAAGLSAAVLVSGIVAAWMYGEAWQTSRKATAAPTAVIGPERMIGAQITNAAFQRAIKDARLRLAFERRSRRAAERASKRAQAAAAHEHGLRVSAEQTAKALAQQLAHARRAADLAQGAADTARDNLAKERAGKSREHERLAREAEAAKRAAEDARAKLAEAQRAKAAAEQEAKQARTRLTFVSHSEPGGAGQAIAELRKQMETERTAREAAEREAEAARSDLAHERSLKRAAWRTVAQLRRRLAAVGGAQTTVVAPKPTPASQTETRAAQEGWSLYSGPLFVKQDGAQ